MRKTSQQKKAKLRRKADRLLQLVVRMLNEKCLICGKPISCGHHYYPKSQCSGLRYDLQNIIPICVACHFSHHNGNPEIHNAVNRIKGKRWQEELAIKKRNSFVKTTIEYYEKIIEGLELALNK